MKSKIYKLVIENINEEDGNVEDAVREVADSIEQGYTSGIVGYSSASWYLETVGENEDEDEDEEEED